ncbi:MAG: CbiX/SirB N-terminal domain-containing protein [Nitrospina sp.]|nr:CbiX/SirB N-terminal domain-containing protein [Nitrospina sp.]
MSAQGAVILIGHGGVPKDMPRQWVTELKKLEAERRAKGGGPTPQEREADRRIREWPRTPENDPYRMGLLELAKRLAPLLGGRRLVIAYNEFCTPSIEQAVEQLVGEGAGQIALVTTMVTPGGSHADGEIPEEVSRLQKRFPAVDLKYAWPFDLEKVAELIGYQVGQVRFDG